MDKVINLNLMKQPVNWIIVPLVILFGLQLFAMLLPATSKQEN